MHYAHTRGTATVAQKIHKQKRSMTWTTLGPSRDFSGPVEYTMQDGWFWDEKRNSKDGTSYYLFSPDGVTSYAHGTPGFTVASNLPELFYTTPNADPSSGTLERAGANGDRIQLKLNSDSATISGIPDHYITSKSAGTQTLSSEIEAIYWEGSYHNDSFDINISSADSSIRSIFYWGETGDDTVTISGAFQVLDGQHKYVDQQLSDVGNAFAGGEGFDRLIINANSYEGFYISYLENENGFMGRGQDLSTRFEIEEASGGYYMAVDVEEVVFLDKTFSRENMVLGTENRRISPLVGNEEDNYVAGTDGDDQVEAGSGGDFIFTGDGNDVVNAGLGDDVIAAASGKGNDRYDGGEGFDIATFTSSSTGLKIDLKKGRVKSKMTGSDSLKSIEGIVGTYYNDSIIGTTGDNKFYGKSGDDVITTNGGRDFIDGGEGSDRAIFKGAAKDYSITSNGGQILVSSSDGRITAELLSVEFISFGKSTFELSTLL